MFANNNTFKFFAGIDNLKDLRKRYCKLMLDYHPDKHPEDREKFEEIAKEINAEHDRAKKTIENGMKCNGNTNNTNNANFDTTKYMQVLDALAGLDGINLELCGEWLWVSGNTYTHKAQIKQAGCKWASKKKMWYWYPEDSKPTSNRSKMSIDDIRDKYGSEKIKDFVKRQKLSA